MAYLRLYNSNNNNPFACFASKDAQVDLVRPSKFLFILIHLLLLVSLVSVSVLPCLFVGALIRVLQKLTLCVITNAHTERNA